MRRTWSKVILGAAMGAVLVLTACGSEDAPADEAQPGLRGGEVDIDGDTVRYRSEDGEAVYEMDDDGQVRVTGDDGETVLTHGDDTVLPQLWPEDLQLPGDLVLTSASTMTAEGQVRMNVTGTVDGDARAVHDDMKQRLVAAGYELQGESFQDDGRAFGTISATNGTDQAAVTTTGEEAAVTVSVFLGSDA